MSDMTTQTVYRLMGQTSFRDLRRFDEAIPTIAAHEVLIKIKSVALNYRDIAITNGTYPFSIKDRLIPCSDGAGEVVEVGDAVTGLQAGDAVVGNFDTNHLYGPRRDRDHTQGGTLNGVLREYVALPEYAVTRIPKRAPMTYPEMASLVCTGVTAWNALYGNIPLKPGQTVLLQGKSKWHPARGGIDAKAPLRHRRGLHHRTPPSKSRGRHNHNYLVLRRQTARREREVRSGPRDQLQDAPRLGQGSARADRGPGRRLYPRERRVGHDRAEHRVRGFRGGGFGDWVFGQGGAGADAGCGAAGAVEGVCGEGD